MTVNPSASTESTRISLTTVRPHGRQPSISVDLGWIDMLKGIAIVGVFFDNWTGYMRFSTEPSVLYSLARAFALAVGPFVHVFFILSGFGLATAYFRSSGAPWNWRKWAWRRITKIVIPYGIMVVASFLLGVLGAHLYESVDVRFSWASLFAYLTFTRNLYPPSWVWNPPLWFMPVIMGLYLSFPPLIAILTRWGRTALLLVSTIITYLTLAVSVLAGAAEGHADDLFTFWLIQFALGIALAHVREMAPDELHRLIGPVAFLSGVVMILGGWGLRTYVPLGKTFNDLVTSVGIFLTLLNLVWSANARVPATGRVLRSLGRQSYLMFLIHYPIMQFVVGPPFRVAMNPIVVILLGAAYVVIIFVLSCLISGSVSRLTGWAYQQYSR